MNSINSKIFCHLLILLLINLISAQSIFCQTSITIGTGSVGNTYASYPAPLQDYWEGSRAQYLYRASELTAAGMTAGTISSIKFNVTALNGFTGSIEEFKMKINGTTVSTLGTTTWENTGANVFGPVNYTPVVGLNTFLLSTPFYWNGTNNILLEICNGDANNPSTITWTENVSVPYTTGLTFNGSRTYGKDNSGNLCGVTDNNSGDLINTATTRPNITFVWTAGSTCNGPGYANLPFTESFENTWVSLCNTRETPNNFWRNSAITGNNSWRRYEDGASAAWTSATGGSYSPIFSAGATSARFHSYYANPGSTGSLSLYINCNTPLPFKKLNFDFINTSGYDSLTILFSTDGGAGFTRLDSVQTAINWRTKTVYFNSQSPSTVVKFVATSDFGNTDIGLDNISVTDVVACSGTPLGGTVAASPTSVCSSSTPIALTVSGSTIAAGITWQWQESTNSGGSWSNITGATNYDFTSPGVSTTTSFRRQISCGTNSSTTNTILVTANSLPLAGTTIASSYQACNAGSSITVSVTGDAPGPSYTYQWQSSPDNSNWSDMVNETNTSLFFSTFNPLFASTYFRRKVSCGQSSSFSASAFIQRICGGSGTESLCNGQTHGVGVETVLGPTYTWYLNGVQKQVRPGNGNAISFNFAINSTDDEGSYTVIETTPGNPPIIVHNSSVIFKDVKGLEIYEYGSTYVKFRWTSTGTYYYAVTTDSTPPLLFSSTTNNDVTINGLTPAVNYYLHIKGSCAGALWHRLAFPQPCPVSTATIFRYCPDSYHTIGVTTISGTTYTWYKDGVQKYIRQGDGNFISFDFLISNLDSTGQYTVIATKPGTTPACISNSFAALKLPLTGLQIVQIGADWVRFKWASPGLYEYAVTTSSTPPGAGTQTSLDSMDVFNLLPSTAYYIHMRSTCIGSPWTTLPFTTKQCYAKPGSTFGAGVFCNNSVVTLHINQSYPDQQYSWLRNGQPVGGAPVTGGASDITYSFTITSTIQSGIYSVRTTKAGCTDSIFGSLQVDYLNPVITGLTLLSKTASEVMFKWNKISTSPFYQYVVSTSNTVPAGGYSSSSDTTGYAYTLANNATYYIYVRAYCGTGYGAWVQMSFITSTYTAPVCASGDIITVDVPVTVGSNGTGVWNFAGAYPGNSVGTPLVGLEKVYRFTPTVTAVYYIKAESASSGFGYMYKLASAGCSNSGWTGLGVAEYSAILPIGLLQAGTLYYILADSKYQFAGAQKFTVSKAKTGTPPSYDYCNLYSLGGGPIPANSTKIEYAIDDNGNLLGSFDFSGVNNSVGTPSFAYYVNSPTKPVRRDGGNKEYLDRNISLLFTNDPVTPVSAKLYFSNTELQRLIDEPNDGLGDVSGLNDLIVTRTDDFCVSDVGFGTSVIPTGNGSLDLYRYLQLNIPVSGSYFFHGGIGALTPETRVSCPKSSIYLYHYSAGAGYSYNWQIDDGSGFVDLSESGIYSGVFTWQLTISPSYGPLSYLYGNKYRLKLTNGVNVSYGASRTIKFVSTWLGTYDSRWENLSNWSCQSLPDAFTDVIIPQSVAYPVVGSHITIRSLQMQPGAKVYIKSPFKFTLTGK